MLRCSALPHSRQHFLVQSSLVPNTWWRGRSDWIWLYWAPSYQGCLQLEAKWVLLPSMTPSLTTNTWCTCSSTILPTADPIVVLFRMGSLTSTGRPSPSSSSDAATKCWVSCRVYWHLYHHGEQGPPEGWSFKCHLYPFCWRPSCL